MSEPAIVVDGISKRFRIGETVSSRSLRDSLVRAAGRPLRLLAGKEPWRIDSDARAVWALREITFSVPKGQILGVIGSNGAGKSTLLKVLARITHPTAGRALLQGRVGSLLEVGTGFHPELTGRENIFLNGAILGMTRRQTTAAFDDIVAFSEIERFLDTPVKRYSSGMYMRLAFAVAAHLEPEILLVDEVLAVGDVAFQRKCMGRMENVATSGRTVLFVSHNMAAIRALCDRVILLSNGELRADGNSAEVVDLYLSEEEEAREAFEQAGGLPIRNDEFGLALERCEVRVRTEGEVDDLVIELELSAQRELTNVGVGVEIRSEDGVRVARLAPSVTNIVIAELKGPLSCALVCPGISRFLAGGRYRLGLWLAKPRREYIIQLEYAAGFELEARDVYSTGEVFSQRNYGLVPLPVELSL